MAVKQVSTIRDEASVFENFVIEKANRKAVLTFMREDRLNALDSRTFHDLIAALDELDADDQIEILIITGRGKGFVAGADINEYLNITLTDYVDFQRLGRRMYDLLIW
jgi:enoyl-CoA hydratase/carnithine racemase